MCEDAGTPWCWRYNIAVCARRREQCYGEKKLDGQRCGCREIRCRSSNRGRSRSGRHRCHRKRGEVPCEKRRKGGSKVAGGRSRGEGKRVETGSGNGRSGSRVLTKDAQDQEKNDRKETARCKQICPCEKEGAGDGCQKATRPATPQALIPSKAFPHRPICVHASAHLRHARACRGHPRLSSNVSKQGVDARHKAGHDGG